MLHKSQFGHTKSSPGKRGCVQSMGLVNTYMNTRKTHNFIKQLLVLPFLHACHIRPVFENMKAREVGPQLKQLIMYIDRQWLSSSVFGVDAWSVYGQDVRTNNDVDGWHRRHNTKANRGALCIFRLVPLLHPEATLVETTLSTGDLVWNVRPKTARLQVRLSSLWDSTYPKSFLQLLFKCLSEFALYDCAIFSRVECYI